MKEELRKKEPILIKPGNKKVLLNGAPPLVDCRVVAEDYYQGMIANTEELQRKVDEYKANEIEICERLKIVDGRLERLLSTVKKQPKNYE